MPLEPKMRWRNFEQNSPRGYPALARNLAKWSSQGAASFGQIDQVAQTLSSHFNVNVDAVNNILARNQQTAQLWKTQLVANLTEVLNVSQNLSVEMERSFTQFDSALGTSIANAIIWQKSIGEAFAKAAVQAITSIAQESLVRAIYSPALGFYLLAIQDYAGAAAAFEAAAMYGAVGGAAALAGRAIAGTEYRRDRRLRGRNVSRNGSSKPSASASSCHRFHRLRDAEPRADHLSGPGVWRASGNRRIRKTHLPGRRGP